jgi:NADH-quinone oxidoreductase subunit I
VFKELAMGLSTTLKVLFREKSTISYPEVKKERSKRFRGRHELRSYENGLEMCVGCELCQVACPAAERPQQPA